MRLPIGLSVPHAGLLVPERLRPRCLLTPTQIVADGDVGAHAIYAPLRTEVERFVIADVARAVVDMNRAADDVSRADGVVKQTTCWGEPVWHPGLDADDVGWLLRRYHAPYHRALRRFAGRVRLGIDCHTMSEFGPPIGPDPDAERPLVCLGHVGGASCPDDWMQSLRTCFERWFGHAGEVRVDDPFAGGFITRAHGLAMPWVQVELSRSNVLSDVDKGRAVLGALREWCASELPRLAS